MIYWEVGMGDYAYTQVPGKLKPFLDKIRSIGVPKKVTNSWLKTIGFTSSNDGTLIGVLKFVGLVDASGTPTSIWSEMRGAKHKAVLGRAIRKGYSELYDIYPDAHLRSTTEISHVFSTSSTAGQQVISKTVATFKALVAEAEFDNSAATDMTLHAGPLHAAPAQMSTPSPQLSPQNGQHFISTFRSIFQRIPQRSKSRRSLKVCPSTFMGEKKNKLCLFKILSPRQEL